MEEALLGLQLARGSDPRHPLCRLYSQAHVVNLHLLAQKEMSPLCAPRRGSKLRAVESVYGRGGGG